MAEIARGELTAQELLSHEMGLHTEKLGGRSQQIFFDFDLNEAHQGFSLPNAYDVDYNKRAEIDASNMPSNTVNLRIRELMQDGYGTIVLKNPGAKHSIAVGILPTKEDRRRDQRLEAKLYVPAGRGPIVDPSPMVSNLMVV